MTSQLTIKDLTDNTQDPKEHFAADLDTTADLPSENTADIALAPATGSASRRCTGTALDNRKEPAADGGPIFAVTPHILAPLAGPLDEQPSGLLPERRAFGFFAFAACAVIAIFVTMMVPQRELSVPEAPAAARVAQLTPIGAELRAAEAKTIIRAPAPRKTGTPAATAEQAKANAPTSFVTFASRSLVTSEKAVAAVFIVKRTKAASGKAIIRWSARSGSADAGIDFSDASGIVRFADGQRQRAIYVPLRDDLLKEGDETFKVCLRSPQRASISGSSCAETTIRDDDSVSQT